MVSISTVMQKSFFVIDGFFVPTKRARRLSLAALSAAREASAEASRLRPACGYTEIKQRPAAAAKLPLPSGDYCYKYVVDG